MRISVLPLDSVVIVFYIYNIIFFLVNMTYFIFSESGHTTVELPPELCKIIMSPISITTFYSFSFLPSIMHRLESLLVAINLKKMHLDHCTQNEVIPTIKVCNPWHLCGEVLVHFIWWDIYIFCLYDIVSVIICMHNRMVGYY